MTDDDVASLLCSNLGLVTIEAPAGCGKTYQGANYALKAADRLRAGRVLILTHTHAARSVFADRTRGVSDRVEIRTIDSFLTEIAAMYHRSLDFPAGVGTWAREHSAYETVAARCKELLENSTSVAGAAAMRYPIIICDEHQDASADQHAAVMALHKAGSIVRFLGDSMQIIYGGPGKGTRLALDRWKSLTKLGGFGMLSNPHRWRSGSLGLGHWVLGAREALERGHSISLAGTLTKGLTVIHASNSARFARKAVNMATEDRRPVSALARNSQQLLILTVGNDRVDHLNAFFNRSMRIWEGHSRDELAALVAGIRRCSGSAPDITEAFLSFVGGTCTGFTASAHGGRVRQEVIETCGKPTGGLPSHLQAISRTLLENPDHRGVALALRRLKDLISARTPGFTEISIDLKSEYQDGIKLGGFESVDLGLTEITRRRTFSHPHPPPKCISTIHKSKGLECDNALIMMCDRQSFSNTDYKRRLLYVGLSRAMKNLTLVVCRDNPSPLFSL
ncbi:ATP-binding domain-containing protein [Rhizobium sp. P32RR-XVIII]|uniref:ATP-binding domain-containing protein n=1 Tax=Rhizobium sp. P32RR-XVIII TaxID=2726738 RepID=UPI0014573ECF|nr:ATP-binding domain-containing protein [Rhizobium sp. P32RR-XVIII]NLS07867.1 ATP-binding domain-containing protein [Rhizobium sp. P32RR-XVIII]